MRINPYLSFNGKCEEAFKNYEKILGGKITFNMKWGESPMAKDMPKESHNLIMHTRLTIGDQAIMGADAPPDRYTNPGGMCVSVSIKDEKEGEKIFNLLAKDGKVHMPFQKTFWAKGFGMCIDRFGIPWMINCEEEQ